MARFRGGTAAQMKGPMLPFDVILFDIGGVLLTNGWDHCERRHVLERFHLDPSEFERRHPEPNDAWERDLITAKEYLDQTVFYEPRHFTADDFLAALFAESVPLPDGGLSILQELAASGKWMLGCLNNEAREPNDYRLQKYNLRDAFDVTLSSCYVGLRKPHASMYRRALDILGRPAKRILFIDDRQENVAGARALGIEGIRFNGAEQLRRDLDTLGVY